MDMDFGKVETSWRGKLAQVKTKAKEFATKVTTTAKAGVAWCAENREVAVPIILAALGTTDTIIKCIDRSRGRKFDMDRTRMFYDPVTRQYVVIKKALNKWQRAEFDRRVMERHAGRSHESYYQILSSIPGVKMD